MYTRRVVLLHPRVGRAVALHHRDRLDAAADDRLDALEHHHVGGLDDRLQAGVAEPVDRDAGDGDREPGAQRGDARDVVAGGAVRLAAAEDDLLDLLGIEAGDLGDRVADRVAPPGRRGG